MKKYKVMERKAQYPLNSKPYYDYKLLDLDTLEYKEICSRRKYKIGKTIRLRS